MKKLNLSFLSLIRLCSILLIISMSGCKYSTKCFPKNLNTSRKHHEFNIDHTVDYVITGDATLAAQGFSFPLHHQGLEPLMQIKNKSDFIRMFPIIFDAGVRHELKLMKDSGGWGFRNWRGESFGNGAFWRENPKWENADKRIHTIMITGVEFDKYYQEIYAMDAKNLSAEYRDDMAWVYAYFTAEDDSFYGRVDVIGKDERKTRGCIADRYRIMIFRKGQKPTDKPSEIYFCKLASDGMINNIVLECGCIKFEIVDIGHEESPWGWLEYTKDKSKGNEGLIRLKADTPWLEKYRVN